MPPHLSFQLTTLHAGALCWRGVLFFYILIPFKKVFEHVMNDSTFAALPADETPSTTLSSASASSAAFVDPLLPDNEASLQSFL